MMKLHIHERAGVWFSTLSAFGSGLERLFLPLLLCCNFLQRATGVKVSGPPVATGSSALWDSDTVLSAGSLARMNLTLVNTTGLPAVRDSWVENYGGYLGFSFVDGSGRANLGPSIVLGEITIPGLQRISFNCTTAGSFALWINVSGVPISGSPFSFYINPGPPSYPACVGSWVDGVHDFSIDTQATVAIKLVDAYNNDVYLSATDATTNLIAYFQGVQDYTSTIFSKTINRNIESVTFNTQLAGNLTLSIVSRDLKDVKNSPFHLFISAGPVSLLKSVGVWYPDNTPLVQAGNQAKYVVTQKDRYGNIICPANGNQGMIDLTAYILVLAGGLLNMSAKVDKTVGQMTFTFTPTSTGKFPFTVEDSGRSALAGLPLSFSVIPGPVSIKDCVATFVYSTTRADGTPLVYAGMPATVKIRLSDVYGNLVCYQDGATNTFFDFTVTLAGEPLVAIAELTWAPTDGSGSQKLTFIPVSAGPTVHHLQIGQGTQAVGNTPLSFAIAPGLLSPANCTGSWLMPSSHSFGVAGTNVNLRVYMMDCCGNNLTRTSGISLLLLAYPSFSVSMQGWESVGTAYKGGIYGSITTINGDGYVDLTFMPVIAGQGSVLVYASAYGVTAQLQNSPFSIILPAGPVYPPNCFSFFSQGDTFHAGSTALIEVVQVDSFGNVVGPQNYQSQSVQFNGSVYENGVRLPAVTVSLAGPVQGSYNGTWILTKASDQYSIRLSALDSKADVTTYTPVLATDSTFTVLPAEVDASHSVVRYGTNIGDPLPAICMSKTVYAGVNDQIRIELRDAYSNSIASLFQNWNSYHFLKFALSVLNGSNDITATVLSQVTNVPNPDGSSLQAITFLPCLAGQFDLQITGGMRETPICGKMTLYVMAGSVFVPYCVGSWQSGVNTAQAGSTITLVVLLRDVYNNSFRQQYTRPQERGFRFNVVRTLGYQNVIRNVLETDPDSNGYSPISFTPLQAGNFQLEVGNHDQAGFGGIIGSPFNFTVTPGDASVSNCVGSWSAGVNKFQAGVNITFQVLMKDRFNNIVSSPNGASSFLTLTMTVLVGDGSRVIPYYNYTYDKSQGTGYQYLYFQMQTMGQFRLQVGSGDQVISGSPFPFTITVGLPMVSQCVGFWSNQVNAFQAGYTTATLNVQLADAFGNSVTVANGGSPLFMFTITVVGVQITRSVIANVTQIPGQQIRFVPIQVGSYQLSVGSRSSIIGSPFSFTVVAGPISIRSCIGQWVSDYHFTSGQLANLSVLLKDAVGNTITSTGQTGAFSFSVSVDVGSPNAISNLQVSSAQWGYIYITFVTVLAAQSMKLRVGSMVGGSWQEQISNSPLSFSVTPGPIQASVCTGAWRSGINQYQRPAVTQFFVTQRDSAGNPVYTTAGGALHPFRATLSMVNSGASMAMSNVTWTLFPGQSSTCVQILSFTPQQDGYFLLKVFDQFGTILGGPYFIWYFSGHVDPNMCAIAGPGLYNSTAGASSSFVIQLKDANGNPAVVTPQLSTLGGITAVLHMQSTTYELEVGIARDPEAVSLFVASYTATVAGTYDILVYYAGQVLKSGLVKTVYPGPLNPGTCSAQGPALQGPQKAGKGLTFQVYTYDSNSNFVPHTNVQVSVSPADGASVTNITVDASGVTTVNLAITKAPQTYLVYVMVASNVATTEAGGPPPLMADSSNPTNVAGSPYQMAVQAARPDPTMCTAIGNGLNAHDSLGQWNPIVVTMKDSYGNPASGYSALLELDIAGVGDYETSDIQDQGNGQYLVQFKPVNFGSYQISISLQGLALTGSPWNTTVVGCNLPIANNDSATTMDGSAVAINVTGNDQVFIGTATVADIPLAPGNGFVTITSNQLLYTPNHQYTGTDLLGYTIQDGYNRTATAYVALRISLKPPHIVSMPSIIAGFEDTPLPSYGGITGMSIDYSRPQDVIYVSLSAGHGSVYTAQPSGGHISLQGTAASLNSSIQNVHYLGNSHFNGNDTITLSVKDWRGNGDTRFLIVIVQPVNDPPWVQVPSPLQIRSLAVNFGGANMPGIVVGDPDVADVRDNQAVFLLVVALEVAGGLLKLTLPVQYRRDISLLNKTSNVWVDRPANSLDDEFVNVQGPGIQFVAPVDVCNTALNQLVFAKDDLNISVRTVDLFVSVNDGGDWGDCINCTGNASLPLSMSVIVEIELLDWLTKLENTWSDTLLATRRILGSTAGSVGIACILLVLLVLHLSRKARLKYKALGFVDADELNQELLCEQSRIFNPMWIPAAAGDPEFRVSSTPNPLLFHARKHEFRHRLMKVNKEVEREMLLGFKEPSDSSIHRAARPSVFQQEASSLPEDEGAGAEWY